MFGSKKKNENKQLKQVKSSPAKNADIKKPGVRNGDIEKIKVLTAEELKNGEKPKKITDEQAELMARALKSLLRD